jgi:hypothetical protein
MKGLVVVLLVCLLMSGAVSAKAADTTIASSKVNPAISSGIFTTLAYTGCSDDSASVGTPTGMGDLNVDSIPGGASVKLDGSPWSAQHCIGTWPTPTCFFSPIYAPYTGNVATGSHTITLALAGYTSYTGTVDICDQKVSYVHKTLTALPPASVTVTTPTPATTTTTAATTTATTTATAATTTAATTSATTSATTAPVTVVTSAPATSATPATVPASGTGSTAAPQGSGSLTITTTPAGAAVYLDGVQRGVSPTVIPGIPQGSHTILLKLDGYKDLSAPVYVTAGITNDFSTGLTPLSPGASAVTGTSSAGAPAATKAQSPGFEAAFGLAALGAILFLRNGSSR